MLTYLFLASKKGFVLDSYRDEAVGAAGPQAAKFWMYAALLWLCPAAALSGERERADVAALLPQWPHVDRQSAKHP